MPEAEFADVQTRIQANRYKQNRPKTRLPRPLQVEKCAGHNSAVTKKRKNKKISKNFGLPYEVPKAVLLDV